MVWRFAKLFQVLTHDILPIFSMMALGFMMGRLQVVSKMEATTLNRIAFLFLQPALIFPLVNGVDLTAFHFDGIALYGLGQLFVFGVSVLVCLYVFKCTLIESWLLAMTTVFVNSLLYIWPISLLMYGINGNLPIKAVVVWDATFSFAFFIITTDLLVNRGQSAGKSLVRLTKNPVLVAIALGLFTNAIGLKTPEPVLTAFKFAGAGAAPLTLFALGVFLSGHSLIPTKKITVISVIKLFAFPIVVGALLYVGERPDAWNDMLLLNAAGPAGAMAFALAVLYGVRTDTIAPVIIWTSTLTLFSLAWLA